MIRYHRPTKVEECPKCGARMKMGERVYMTFAWERGNRFDRWSTSGFLCRKCAEEIAGAMKLGTFEQKE